MSAADTKISIGEASLVNAGYILFVPQTGEQLLVTEVDGDLSEAWTNGAGDACNVTVDRSILPGPTRGEEFTCVAVCSSS